MTKVTRRHHHDREVPSAKTQSRILTEVVLKTVETQNSDENKKTYYHKFMVKWFHSRQYAFDSELLVRINKLVINVIAKLV